MLCPNIFWIVTPQLCPVFFYEHKNTWITMSSLFNWISSCIWEVFRACINVCVYMCVRVCVSLCMYTCVLLHVHEGVFACVCKQMQRPEVDTGSLPWSPPKHSLRQSCQCSHSAGQFTPGIPLCLLSTGTIGRLHAYAVFMMVLKIWTVVLTLAWYVFSC